MSFSLPFFNTCSMAEQKESRITSTQILPKGLLWITILRWYRNLSLQFMILITRQAFLEMTISWVRWSVIWDRYGNSNF